MMILFQGQVFFALLDGPGLEINLTGISAKPQPVLKISRDIMCKTMFSEQLPVENWLPTAQRSGYCSSFNGTPRVSQNKSSSPISWGSTPQNWGLGGT